MTVGVQTNDNKNTFSVASRKNNAKSIMEMFAMIRSWKEKGSDLQKIQRNEYKYSFQINQSHKIYYVVSLHTP